MLVNTSKMLDLLPLRSRAPATRLIDEVVPDKVEHRPQRPGCGFGRWYDEDGILIDPYLSRQPSLN